MVWCQNFQPVDKECPVRSVARTAYSYLASLFLVGVIVEFFLAGLGVFRTQAAATKTGTNLTTAAFKHSFESHLVVGNTLGVLTLALVGCALAARIGRKGLIMIFGLLLIVLVQSALAYSGPSWLRALHPVLGLVVLGAAGHVAYRAWRPDSGQTNEVPSH
jgi:hypothetical protein